MPDLESRTKSIVLPPVSEKAIVAAADLSDKEIHEQVLYKMLNSNPHLFWYLERMAMILGIISDSRIFLADAYLQGAGRYYQALTITAQRASLAVPTFDKGHIVTYAMNEGAVEHADSGILSISERDYKETIELKRMANRFDFFAQESEMARELNRTKPAFRLRCDDYASVENGILDVWGILQNYYLAQKAQALFDKEVK